MVNVRGMKDLPTEEYSPEKAGVGGSIPSLATTPKLPRLMDLSVLPSAIELSKRRHCGVHLELKLVTRVCGRHGDNGVGSSSRLNRCRSAEWYRGSHLNDFVLSRD